MSPERSSLPFDWDELLTLIEFHSVVPIVGRELLTLSADYGGIPLEHYLANRLAEELKVAPGDLRETPDINEVAVADLRRAGHEKAETRKLHIQKKLASIAAERSWPVPEPLRQLASITDFDLFVTTTTDSLLRQTIDTVRFDGAAKTQELAYGTRRTPDDIPTSDQRNGQTYVYQLFGNLKSVIDYAVTDEDRIEILHRLQNSGHQPSNLFEELREKHLLLLGCGFADGLTRILVRTLANKRLFGSKSRNKMADSRAFSDAGLSSFLQHCGAEIYVAGSAADFTSQLLANWRERAAPVAHTPASRPADPRVETTAAPQGSIFLSYKREDEARVRRLKDALERAGMKVWFDRQALIGGENWRVSIEKNIDCCTLFIPIISRSSQAPEGEFRREWTLALDRAQTISPELPFIIATLIDSATDLRQGDNATPLFIPPEFLQKQYIQCLDQDSTELFVQTVRTQMTRKAQLEQGGF